MSCKPHSKDIEGQYSAAITKCIKIITDQDFSFVLNSKLPVSGRIWYEEKSIQINEPCAGCALIVAIHEIGHMLSFLINSGIEKEHRNYREIMAWRLGWKVIKANKWQKLIGNDYKQRRLTNVATTM